MLVAVTFSAAVTAAAFAATLGATSVNVTLKLVVAMLLSEFVAVIVTV